MRLFGHPVHPMLVHAPITLWGLATACDGLTLLGVQAAGPPSWWCLAIASAAAVPTMAAGLAEFADLPSDAAPLATRHMMLMALAWTAYLGALVLRSDGLAPADTPSPLSMSLGLAGLALMGVGAWCGGQLVYGRGVGVRRPGGN